MMSEEHSLHVTVVASTREGTQKRPNKPSPFYEQINVFTQQSKVFTMAKKLELLLESLEGALHNHLSCFLQGRCMTTASRDMTHDCSLSSFWCSNYVKNIIYLTLKGCER